MSLLFDWRVWLAAAVGVLGLAVWVQTERLNVCRDGLVAERQKVAFLAGEIGRQNAAIDALKAESDRRVGEASKGLAKATTDAQAARGEAARLRITAKEAGAQKAPAQACPAGRAVATIRRGL